MINECGEIVAKCWYDLPNRYHHIQMGEFIIMPNHMHGIIVINPSNVGAQFIAPSKTPRNPGIYQVQSVEMA